MRAILLVTSLWAVLWLTGGALFGRFVEGTKSGGSWLVAIPFCLPAALAVWTTVAGAIAFDREKVGAIPGAMLGVLTGGGIGVAGFFALVVIARWIAPLLLDSQDAWEDATDKLTIAWGIAGLAVGAGVGLLVARLYSTFRLLAFGTIARNQMHGRRCP